MASGLSVAMWIVAGLVARLNGRPFDQFVRARNFEPHGLLASWIGMLVEVFRSHGDRYKAAPPAASWRASPPRRHGRADRPRATVAVTAPC